MKKILIIIQREYYSRVKKRSFIIMTILGPILMAGIMIVPYFIAKMGDEERKINVVDETGIYYQKLQSNKTIKFNYLLDDIETAKSNFDSKKVYALLYIPKPSANKPTFATLYYSNKQPSITVTSYIQDKMKYAFENEVLVRDFGIEKKQIDAIKTSITIQPENISTGESTQPVLSTFIGIFGGVLIYFFIFLFGSQVMRGVIEEKTSRIVEVIVSSVKPFQLMMGKILGIALVGLTQFMLWVVLTLAIVGIFQVSFSGKMDVKNSKQQFQVENNALFPENAKTQDTAVDDNEMNSVFKSIGNYDFIQITLAFLFFFMFGYLLYAALFAAIGSAVDSEADTQQFMLPITVPLIFSFVMMQYIIENPQGPMAFWLSIIPLTSPIVMMIRLPFGVPAFDFYLSMILLVIGFLGTTWIAGKIYRTGILMYGKKVSYKELWKWLTYKN
jgi:ABC-2 type transport system permease protein